MFAYIKGTLEEKGIGAIVIEAGGIGYRIFMSQKTIGKLGELGEQVKIYTHYHVREDDVSLYGFLSNEELKMFELLISVSGVGAKSAISMLSEITPSKFALAVISNDVGTLKSIKGVGAKTAQRIILELKDKLKTTEAIEEKSEELESAIVVDDRLEEAMQALKVLGYTRAEITSVMGKFDKATLGVEDIIKKALVYLAR
ncbi:MAG: Holliday junction branch migration protein RuvA [Clostridia bacterium]